MVNLTKVMLLILAMLSSSCSEANLTDKIYRGPSLIVVLKQEYLQVELSKIEGANYNGDPNIIIEAVTPVVCRNYRDGKFGSDCAFDDDKPLPEKIEFRYGVWLSNEEADKRYPPVPFEAYENDHNSDDYESMDEYLAADEAFRRQITNKPEYKKIREAKRAAMDKDIDWHTYTIYPREIIQKYHDEMGLINRLRASIVYYTITFHYDMSVTEKDEIMYLDPALPWWLTK